jgi:hypothetical protein
MEYLLVVVVLVAVVWFVTGPLRRHADAAGDEREDPRMAALEARKEAKYREIRDTELDHAAGKLSDADFARQDAELRREAIAILKELDDVRGKTS